MELDLPLARGSLDAMTLVREKCTIAQIISGGSHVFRGLVEGTVTDLRLIFLNSNGSVALTPSGDGLHVWSQPASVASRLPFVIDEGDAAVIGRTVDGVVFIAVTLPEDAEGAVSHLFAPDRGSDTPVELQWHSVRRVGHLLGDDDSALSTAATALHFWRSVTRFCSRCGARVTPSGCGWTVTCHSCHHIEYPRQDPAIIVAIVDEDDRLLLAHNAGWKPGYYSLIAGFTEAGEAPELAVVREAREETGLEVGDVRYQGSQPWPFPRSLMLGFTARVRGGRDCEPPVRPDGSEITDAAFYTREEFAQSLSEGRIVASSATAIAHGLIQQWFGAPYLHLQGEARCADARAH